MVKSEVVNKLVNELNKLINKTRDEVIRKLYEIAEECNFELVYEYRNSILNIPYVTLTKYIYYFYDNDEYVTSVTLVFYNDKLYSFEVE